MRGPAARRRRDVATVLGRSVVVGAVCGAPVALLIMPTLSVVQALVGGAGWEEAWRAASMTAEDWEMVPAFLLLAVCCGAASAVPAALVWSFTAARTRGPWPAHLAAAAFSAAVPLALLVAPNQPLAVAGALGAVLVTLVAAPRVGYESLPSR